MPFEFEKELKVTKTKHSRAFGLRPAGAWRQPRLVQGKLAARKMTALGLPDFGPVQNNISYNEKKGVTRGIHAEPWDKYISIAAGEIFGAWVDLRSGESFGQVFTTRLDPSRAIFVPRGVGNSFQALQDGTVYTYLVNAHWSLEQKKTYTFVNLADPDLGIEWPIPLEQSERSEADLHHPMLKDAKPMAPRRTLVTGANGQLGQAIEQYVRRHGLQGFEFTDRDEFDFSDSKAYEAYDWSLYGTIINAGAYTAVDKAETDEGRVAAWKANAQGPALLARVATEHNITLVHVSSDYVFDGTTEEHTETEPFSPLGVYGQSKAAGDIAVSNSPRHYILRSSWVIGQGHNFVNTMMELSNRVADPNDTFNAVTVVNDQYGRLTFTDDMAEAIFHLLNSGAAYGTYNLTGSGAVRSWAEIAAEVFDKTNGNGDKVKPVSTADYYARSTSLVSPRPRNSALNLSKIEHAGYRPADWEQSLQDYMNEKSGR
ncbi:dTDP-4-dehydrorhamnose reductase/dTDP-4-keto-6-deoxyglucose-3,5-epimerase [Bifidobacterium bombi DSM 19703]|uniref:dTDP-4-dehydrorhamnose reductase n=1 Tax=Bifidobacterium bombi DSM 19703 TaxID=1341695 RepID=A0A086BPI8_9BIFI|nr:dTDP-4-dehydrorhamnose reductase/dTDP-4-keto-6-deoxyglucose-3,5-epimerase [Bifidobacterium bombi DSM 19703]